MTPRRRMNSRADSWLGWGEARESDNVLRSLGRIFQISLRGMGISFRNVFGRHAPERKSARLSVVRGLIPFFLAALLSLGGQKAHAQPPGNAGSPQSLAAGIEGILPLWTYLQMWFSQRPWLAALVVVLLSFLLAVWLRQWLRARARARLTLIED